MELNKKLAILNYMDKLDFNNYLWFIYGVDYNKELSIGKKLLNKEELEKEKANNKDLVSLSKLVDVIITNRGDFYYLGDDNRYTLASLEKKIILKEIANEVRSKITPEELQTGLLGVKI